MSNCKQSSSKLEIDEWWLRDQVSFLSPDERDASVSTAALDCEERVTRIDWSAGMKPSAVGLCWRPAKFEQLCEEGKRRRRTVPGVGMESSASVEAAAAASTRLLLEEFREAASDEAEREDRMEMARARRPIVRRSSPRTAATIFQTSPEQRVTMLPRPRQKKMTASTSTCHSRHVGSHAMHKSTHELYAWNPCTHRTTAAWNSVTLLVLRTLAKCYGNNLQKRSDLAFESTVSNVCIFSIW